MGGVVLWAKLSKSVKCSQALDLGADSLEPELQHFTMSWTARGVHLRLGPRQSQFEPGLSGCTLLLFSAQLRLQGLPPLGFLLL
jgi:hypothetical protein